MTIVCKEPYHALSNTLDMEGYPKYLAEVRDADELLRSSFVDEFLANDDEQRKARVFRFAETPVMSTYLVAMAVTTFDHAEITTEDGLLIRLGTIQRG